MKLHDGKCILGDPFYLFIFSFDFIDGAIGTMK